MTQLVPSTNEAKLLCLNLIRTIPSNLNDHLSGPGWPVGLSPEAQDCCVTSGTALKLYLPLKAHSKEKSREMSVEIQKQMQSTFHRNLYTHPPGIPTQSWECAFHGNLYTYPSGIPT